LHLFVGNCCSAGVLGHWTGGKILFAAGSPAIFPFNLTAFIISADQLFDDNQVYYPKQEAFHTPTAVKFGQQTSIF
jgi:hypothetical protein